MARKKQSSLQNPAEKGRPSCCASPLPAFKGPSLTLVHVSRDGLGEWLFLHQGVFSITDTMTVPQSGYFITVAALRTNCKMDE